MLTESSKNVHLHHPQLLHTKSTASSRMSSSGSNTNTTRPSTANSSSSTILNDFSSDSSDSDFESDSESIGGRVGVGVGVGGFRATPSSSNRARKSRNSSASLHHPSLPLAPPSPRSLFSSSGMTSSQSRSTDPFSISSSTSTSTPNSPSQSFTHIHMSGSNKPPPSPNHQSLLRKDSSKPCSILRKSSSSSSTTTSSSVNHPTLKKKSSSKPSLNNSTEDQEWSKGLVDLQDERQRKELESRRSLLSERQSDMIFENQRDLNRDLQSVLGLKLFDERDDFDFDPNDKVTRDQLRSSSSSQRLDHHHQKLNQGGEKKICKQRNSRSSSDSSSRGVLSLGHINGHKKRNSNHTSESRKGRSESSPIIPSRNLRSSSSTHSQTSSPDPNETQTYNSKGLGLSNLEIIESSTNSSPTNQFNLNLPGYFPTTLTTIPPTPSAADATWIDKDAQNYFPAGLKYKEKERKSSGRNRSESIKSSKKKGKSSSNGEVSRESSSHFTTSNEIDPSTIPTPSFSSNVSSPNDSAISSHDSHLPQTPSDSDLNHHHKTCPANSAFKEISDPTHGSRVYYVKREFQSLGLKIRFRLHDAKRKLQS